MSTDKFGNLFYVDKARQNISKISGTELEAHFSGKKDESGGYSNVWESIPGKPFLTNRVLYDTATTESASNIEDISIEREYLYWTNSANNGRHGSIHKAFTEPFGRAVPFQTYDNYEILSA